MGFAIGSVIYYDFQLTNLGLVARAIVNFARAKEMVFGTASKK